MEYRYISKEEIRKQYGYINNWVWSSFDEITCLKCGFTHKDEVFWLIDNNCLFDGGLLYCPCCGTKMNGLLDDQPWHIKIKQKENKNYV